MLGRMRDVRIVLAGLGLVISCIVAAAPARAQVVSRTEEPPAEFELARDRTRTAWTLPATRTCSRRRTEAIGARYTAARALESPQTPAARRRSHSAATGSNCAASRYLAAALSS